MGACQAYDGGKGHTMVGSGTGILWQYFMNTLFLAPHRRFVVALTIVVAMSGRPLGMLFHWDLW